ncbi:MAG: glycosyltransferase [Cognaticolwellia sp.]
MEKLVCDLATERTAGKTTIVCLNTLGTLGEQVKDKVNITVLSTPKNLFKGLYSVYKEIKKQQPDIIHCHNLQAHFFGSVCAKLIRKSNVILTKHGQFIPNKGMSAKVNQYTLKNTKIVGVSSDISSLMRNWITNCKYPITFIPNGISLKPFDSIIQNEITEERLSAKVTKFCVVMVARLSPPKDPLILLQAIAKLKQKKLEVSLFIIGDGPLRESIENEINQLKIQDNVTLFGERNDIPIFLKAANLFVLTSSSEGIPMTILEAMAAKLPVVATNVGGIHHIVDDGQSGMLVKDKDLNQLCDALTFFIENPEKCQKMGANGRALLEKEYSMESTLALYESLYNE